MLDNPIKGQTPVKTTAGDLVFVLTFPAQKVCEVRFNRRFLDIAEDLDELLLSDIGFIFWAGLQHFQPHLSEADTDAIVTEIGVLAMYKVIGDGVRAAFDQGEVASHGVASAVASPRKARSRPTP